MPMGFFFTYTAGLASPPLEFIGCITEACPQDLLAGTDAWYAGLTVANLVQSFLRILLGYSAEGL